MLLPRIIPCLLIKDGGLVKTTKFSEPKYVGDPINAVRIFNEKEVDELVVVDIDATAQDREPNYSMIRDLAAECRMPFCYGGGIKNVSQIEKIIGLGVEKVAMSSSAISDPKLVTSAATIAGSQSIVVVMDVQKRRIRGGYELMTHNASRKTGICPFTFALQAQDMGAGEIIINSIDRDGTMMGYDKELIGKIHKSVTIPVTALGGAGSLDDIAGLIESFGILGVAAGSLFVFKGKYRAVLISYPGIEEKNQLAGKVTR